MYAWNTSGRVWSTTPSEHVKYVWGPAGSVGVPAGQSAQWLVLMELDGLNSNAALKKYTWGLDLAGLNGSVGQVSNLSLEAAGGIGGLLAVSDSGGSDPNLAGDYVFFYDGNGNVTQVARDIAGIGSIAVKLKARYEYDPYGNVIGPDTDADGVIEPSESGPYARWNTMRFSTKPWEDATGLGHWVFRPYSAKLGRWISRDPMGEPGFDIQSGVAAPRWGGSASMSGDSGYTYVSNHLGHFSAYDPVGLCQPGNTQTVATTRSCGFCYIYTKACNECQICKPAFQPGACIFRWRTVDTKCSPCGTAGPIPACTWPTPAPVSTDEHECNSYCAGNRTSSNCQGCRKLLFAPKKPRVGANQQLNYCMANCLALHPPR